MTHNEMPKDTVEEIEDLRKKHGDPLYQKALTDAQKVLLGEDNR